MEEDAFVAPGTFATLEKAVKHVKSIHLALLANKAGTNKILVIRSHQTPFNLEGDMKEFFYPITFTEGKITVTAKSVMDQMKDCGVFLFIGSHHHSGQILAYKYGSTTKMDSAKPKLKDLRTKDFKQCTNAPTDFAAVNQAYADDCAKKEYAATVSFSAPTYLFVLVIGNSGRFFDPIESPTGTYAKLLFGRAKTGGFTGNASALPKYYEEHSASNLYGGANIAFTGTAVKVAFFETAITGQGSTGTTYAVTETATLTLTDGTNGTLKSVDDHTSARLTADATTVVRTRRNKRNSKKLKK